jgi:hypothetical protein
MNFRRLASGLQAVDWRDMANGRGISLRSFQNVAAEFFGIQQVALIALRDTHKANFREL